MILENRYKLILSKLQPYLPGNIPTTNHKMVYWRELGLNYLRFSQIAARELRNAIKPDARAKYPGQGEATIKRFGTETGQAKKEAAGEASK